MRIGFGAAHSEFLQKMGHRDRGDHDELFRGVSLSIGWLAGVIQASKIEEKEKETNFYSAWGFSQLMERMR